MYFAQGWPRTFCVGNTASSHFVDIKCSPDGCMVATATISEIYIWSGDQHRIVLGKAYRHNLSVTNFGTNVGIVWSTANHGENQLIAVLTSKGFVHLYVVTTREDTDLCDFKLNSNQHFIHLGAKHSVKIEFRVGVDIEEGGTTSITASGDHLYAFTKGGNVVKMNWDGKIVENIALSAIPFVSHKNKSSSPPLGVYGLFFDYSAALNMFGIILSNGKAGIIQMMAKSLHHAHGTYIVSKNKAVCLSLNAKHELIAIGCENGEINLYHIVGATFARTFSLATWGINAEYTGSVNCLQWTPDYCALAVGWSKRGLSVWSIYGCRLMCTIPQLEGSYSRPHTSQFKEPLKNGVSCLSWGPEGYQLMVANKNKSKGKMVQFSFLKSLATNPNLNGCERILLQGEDIVLLLSYKGKELDDITWKHLQIPHPYLSDNWPIKYVAVSRDGTQLAMAGKHGITVYNSINKRWKIFGDRNQERQITCFGLSWYKHVVILASLSTTNQCYEFLFYPKSHLDASSLLHKSQIPQKRKPLFVDCNDDYLILLTTDSFFYQYLIKAVYNEETDEIQSIDLVLVHQVSMAGVTSCPLSFTLLPQTPISRGTDSLENTANNSATSANCLILNSSGLLTLTNAEEKRQVNLATYVEQFWIANYSANSLYTNINTPLFQDYEIQEDLGNTLWAYGESGLQLWYPFFSDKSELQATKLLSRDKSLEFDLEVYPIGFVPELGVIVGLTQEVNYSSCSKYPFFDIKIKTHPFLHSILRHLIENGNESKAFAIARKFIFIPHFAHSLELLLHETLEDERVDSSAPFRHSELLQRVVRFLSQFAQFPDVVMRCARKTDPAIWKYLFALAGSPKKLFEQCIASKKVQTAASYLRILQHIEGPRESRLCALKLLDEALNSDDLELAGDLMRFLQPQDFDPVDTKSFKSSKQEETEEREINDIGDDQEYYLQELLLARYARKLLGQQQLKKLLNFAESVGHEIKPWLIRERRRAAAIEDFTTTLAVLHLQFNIPYPQTLPDSVVNMYSSTSDDEKGSTNSNNDSEHTDSISISNYAEGNNGGDAPYHHDVNHHHRRDLKSSRAALSYLFKEMLGAQCTEWALVIATVLLDVSQIVSILKESTLWKPYQKMLQEQESGGYKALLPLLEPQFPLES